VDDPVTRIRLATVAASGFDDESKMAAALLEFVDHVGKELLENGKLSDEQTIGLKRALNDTPIAFRALTSLPLPPEQKSNLIFVLTKLMDDMLSLAATAMTAGDANIASKVMNGALRGGLASAETRRSKQRAWRDQALKVVTEIVQKNNRLTLDDLVTKLEESWRSEWARLPGRKLVIAFLSAARKDGTLPPRTQ
jgi:hypothetical protein